jgi:hypothetical protein
MRRKIMEHRRLERCEVCGAKDVLGLAVCSTFGAHTFACCEACLAVDKEPYRAIVNYISAAGHWPQDINKMYQREVRRQLKLHNKTEEEFRNDVEEAIAEEQAAMIEYYRGKVEF